MNDWRLQVEIIYLYIRLSDALIKMNRVKVRQLINKRHMRELPSANLTGDTQRFTKLENNNTLHVNMYIYEVKHIISTTNTFFLLHEFSINIYDI